MTSESEIVKSDCYEVFFTTRAYLQLVSEVSSYPFIETGGVFIGRRIGNKFYIFETTDPGPKAIRNYASHRQDFEYANHLCSVLCDLYQDDINVIGYYHRHPGNYDHFSEVDAVSNADYAKMCDGAISGLVNVDPNYRLQMWYIPTDNSQPVMCNSIKIDDNAFKDILKLKDYNDVINLINKQEKHKNSGRFSVFNKVFDLLKNKNIKNDLDDSVIPEDEHIYDTSELVFKEIETEIADISKIANISFKSTSNTECTVTITSQKMDSSQWGTYQFFFTWNDDGKLVYTYEPNEDPSKKMEMLVYNNGCIKNILDKRSVIND